MIKKCVKCGKEFKTRWKNTVHCSECKLPYGREDRGLKDILDSIKDKKQRATLNKWANERTANGFNIKGTVSRLYTLRRIAKELDKPFEQYSKEDITNLLANNGFNRIYYKKLIKQFFKWLSGTDDYPALVKWIKIKRTIEETPEEHKALTDEELKSIINNTDNQRDRTIFMILAENPTRPRDICNLRIKDVDNDEYGFELKLGSKTPTGRRTIRLINAAPDFKLYWNSIPELFKKEQNNPLFFQHSSNRYGQPLGWGAMKGALDKAVKRARINRKVTLYDFRRTATTNLLQDPRYTPEEVKVMGGWSSIRMFDTYGKVTSEMVNKKKLKVNGLIKSKEQLKKDLLKPILCPRCQEQNPSTSISCQRCWLPLKKEAINIKDKVINKSLEWGRPLNKDLVREVLKEMIKAKDISL